LVSYYYWIQVTNATFLSDKFNNKIIESKMPFGEAKFVHQNAIILRLSQQMQFKKGYRLYLLNYFRSMKKRKTCISLIAYCTIWTLSVITLSLVCTCIK